LAKPHQVISAGTKTYEYDENGNMIKRANQTITYTPTNKVARLTINDDKSIDFYYDTNDYRYKKSTQSYDRYYLDKEYEKTEYKNNNEEEKYFIYVNNKVVATYTKEKQDENINTTTNYLYYDNLDSVDMITNNKGEILQRYIYTPFGKKITLDKDGNIISNPSTNRGYTGHEDIEEDDTLVNMNARLYDSTIGRFISADTLIPDPFSTQDFNRYSYVLNNPMKYTDPTGNYYASENEIKDDWIYDTSSTSIEIHYVNNVSKEVRIIRHVSKVYKIPRYRKYFDGSTYVSHFDYATVSKSVLLNSYSQLDVNQIKVRPKNHLTPFEDTRDLQGLEPNGLEDASAIFIPISRAIQGVVNTIKATYLYSKIPSYSPKISKQMRKRNWTNNDIYDALKSSGIPTYGKKGPATRYKNKRIDKSLTIDNNTYEVFHVGGKGFKYD
jgi:RHS repeat-associated protein